MNSDNLSALEKLKHLKENKINEDDGLSIDPSIFSFGKKEVVDDTPINIENNVEDDIFGNNATENVTQLELDKMEEDIFASYAAKPESLEVKSVDLNFNEDDLFGGEKIEISKSDDINIEEKKEETVIDDLMNALKATTFEDRHGKPLVAIKTDEEKKDAKDEEEIDPKKPLVSVKKRSNKIKKVKDKEEYQNVSELEKILIYLYIKKINKAIK
jgi:hypothetical protein